MRFSFIAGCVLLFVAQCVLAQNALVLTIQGGIGPASADYVVRNIDKAQKSADIIILAIDTPGGLSKSTREIVKSILASTVPVVAFVTPQGARAASAGTFILYAAPIAAMAPGTHLGAASPVSLAGGFGQDKASKKKSTMTKKATNDAVAYIRSLAQLHKRNVNFAEKAVLDAATLTASEALEKNVVNLIASDMPALMKKLNGYRVVINGKTITLNTKGIKIEKVIPDWRTRFLLLVTSPTVAYLLLLLGIYGIFFELVNPGVILPGVVGAIAIVIALYALHMLPINYAGLGLILLGMLFMIAEGFIPSFGALGMGGVIAFILGSLFLIDTEYQGYRIASSIVWGMAAVNALFFFIVMRMAIKAKSRTRENGLESMIGCNGVCMSDLDLTGQVKIKGEIWQAQTNQPIAKNKPIEVIDVHGLILVVQEIKGDGMIDVHR